MRGRLIIAGAIAVVLAAVAFGTWSRRSRGAHTAPADGPVIIISIDTLRADRLSIYGGGRARTPQIDRLAGEGVIFENAYAHSPQTLPSHTSILSGQLPFEHGVRDNIGFTVRPDQRSLQHLLKDAGYATGAFVSSYVLRRQTGFGAGFDRFDDELPAVSAETPLGSVQRPGTETVARAVRWIDEQAGGRFFLFAHIYEPHTPYAPPPRFPTADRYDGEIEFSDEIVGGLLEHLRRTGLYDGATIVLLSDHGEGLGDHGEAEHGIFLYRETIRVPLVIKLPRGTGAGRRVPAPVQHLDLVPTILDLLQLGDRGPWSGRSLLPAIRGDGALAAATIYSESLSPRYHFGWSELYALSDERYRFIRAPRDELYDLTRDPAELTSIAADRDQVRTAMRGALERLIASTVVAAPATVSAEDRERLAALGYVGTQTGSNLKLAGDQLPDPKDKIKILQLYREAGQLAGSGQLVPALAAYEALLREDAAMTDVWLRLADVRARLGDHQGAFDAYREVIGRNPQDAAALTGAATVLLRLGRVEDAVGHAELAVPVAPAIAHEILARTAAFRKDAVAARRHARLAQDADPTLPMVDFVEGLVLHGAGEWQAAAVRFASARAAAARRTEALADLDYYAADTLARLEQYPEAEALFKRELTLSPTHVRAHAGLAMLYRATGRTAESDAAVEALVRQVPTAEGRSVAAQLWTMFGEPRRAAALRAR
jgi:choline-sulfatase